MVLEQEFTKNSTELKMSYRKSPTGSPRESSQKLFKFDSILQTVLLRNPPTQIQVRKVRLLRSTNAFYKCTPESNTQPKFAASTMNDSPRNTSQLILRERKKLMERMKGRCSVPDITIISRSLKLEKMNKMQLHLLQLRSELDSQMQNRIKKVRFIKDDQLFDHIGQIQEKNQLLQRTLSPCYDKHRYRERVQRLHEKRLIHWNPSQRLKELSSPTGSIRSPYKLLRLAISPDPFSNTFRLNSI